jgi:hypothetical protein
MGGYKKIMMKAKTRANKEKNLESEDTNIKDQEEKKDSTDQQMKDYEIQVNRLAHLGELGFQILVKWSETNHLLREQNELLKERNEILREEDYEEESDDEAVEEE